MRVLGALFRRMRRSIALSMTSALMAAASPLAVGNALADSAMPAKQAGGAVVATKAAAPVTPFGEGLMWRIARQSQKPCHIYGAIHLSDPRVLDLPPEVRTIFERSEKVVLEVAGFEQLNQRIVNAMVLPKDQSLSGIIGSKLFEKLHNALESRGFSAVSLSPIQPWAAYIFLTLSSDEMRRAVRGIPVLDHWFEIEALNTGKQVLGLETFDEHLQVLEGIPTDMMRKILASAVDNADMIDQQQNELVTAYLRRDLAALQQMLLAPASQGQSEVTAYFQDRVIDRRNRLMVERMGALLAEGGCFIAVGALHLPGEHGILNLLSEQGAAVTRVY